MATTVADLAAAAPEATGARTRRGIGSLELAIPIGVLVLMVLACFAGPALFHIAGPNVGSVVDGFARPGSPGHLLGTDDVGNDMLSRCLFGGRYSLEIGVGATALGTAIGGTAGVVAGFLGGWLESVVMRFLDMLLSFPSILLAMVVAVVLGQSELHLIYALALFAIPASARIARSGAIRVRELDFVASAWFAGKRAPAIMLRHVVPNVVAPLLTFSLLSVATVMIIEASLSFLGVGLPPPAPSWGGLIADGQSYLQTDPYLVLVPACFLFVTIASLNLIGDSLRSRWRV